MNENMAGVNQFLEGLTTKRVQKRVADWLLQKIEQTLVEKERNFICSDDAITVVDIQYYNEIQQVLKLGDVKSIDKS